VHAPPSISAVTSPLKRVMKLPGVAAATPPLLAKWRVLRPHCPRGQESFRRDLLTMWSAGHARKRDPTPLIASASSGKSRSPSAASRHRAKPFTFRGEARVIGQGPFTLPRRSPRHRAKPVHPSPAKPASSDKARSPFRGEARVHVFAPSARSPSRAKRVSLGSASASGSASGSGSGSASLRAGFASGSASYSCSSDARACQGDLVPPRQCLRFCRACAAPRSPSLWVATERRLRCHC
jgi:hypothetical protein